MKTKLLPILAVAFATTNINCATSTMVKTAEPGAKVATDDGKELGVTPYTYTTSMWIWESQKLKVTSASGQSKVVEVKRSEVDPLPMVGGAALTFCTGIGCVIGIPLILAGGMKAPAETTVVFDEKTGFLRVPTEGSSVAVVSTPAAATGTFAY